LYGVVVVWGKRWWMMDFFVLKKVVEKHFKACYCSDMSIPKECNNDL